MVFKIEHQITLGYFFLRFHEVAEQQFHFCNSLHSNKL